MFKLFSIWAGCFLLLGQKVYSQEAYRKKNISSKNDTVTIDTLSIIPGSVKITFRDSLTIDPSSYKIDAAKAQLIWLIKPDLSPLEISYQTFSVLFTRRYFNRSLDQVTENVIDNREYQKKEVPVESNTLFSLEGLNKSGSISRGVGVGNNQDLAVNSNMTLQLAGKISDDLEILAAISDDNIPIQPEGNTQQINDFDKVFIQLKRRNSILTGGDFELRRPESYFMNFFKRTQGGSFSTLSEGKQGWKYKTSVSAAVAKGRSSRLLFNGIEGNQGPYRLTGSNNEQTIIVLSGTDRVFLDGQLLTRGQENDYVIDYNTAEISFTARRLITQYSRIIVEFEYSDRNYARSLTYLNQEASGARLNFRFNYYSEQDNRNQPFLQDLSDTQKQFLQTIGNQTNLALFPNVTSVEFNTTEVLYKQLDTLGATGVYVYSTDPAAAKFRPGFSFVGANNGSYVISTTSAANGRVFEFVGQGQGNYDPVTLLITPKKQQLVTFATDYKAGKNTFFSTEFAFSDNDRNLFSSLGNNQNRGLGLKLHARNEVPFKGDDTTSLRLISIVNYEQVSENFKPLERYRSIEFERDFNLAGLQTQKAEQLGNLSLSLFKNPDRYITYQFASFTRDDTYRGYQNSLDAVYNFRTYRILYTGRLLNSASDLTKGNFLRQRADISRSLFNLLRVGLNFEQEHNKAASPQSQLLGNSLWFDQYRAYLNSELKNGNGFKLEYSKRFDKQPTGDVLNNYANADVLSGELNLHKNPNSVLTISSTYRDIKYRNEILKENENTLLGRIDYNLNALKGFFNSSVFYEIGPGREPKREFSYLEVITGQGAYAWNDYNNNGIKELNEFEIARFKDQARYIRIYQNTNEFISTDYTTINYTLRLTPALLYKNREGFFKMLNHFSSQTAYKTERKSAGQTGFSAYDPFAHIPSQNLISDNTFFRNTLFFNRNHPVYGIDFNYQTAGNKLLLINGFDSRNRNEGGFRFRLNVKKTNLILETRQGVKHYASELFEERNYRIKFLEFLPEINYQLNTNFRMNVTGAFRQQNNRINNQESSINYRLGSDIRYNILRKGTLNSGINLVRNQFDGETNTSLAYEMLEGLQPGNNMIWTAGLQRSIAQGVQLNVGYEGRKSARVKTIHTASLQFRAFF